MFVEAVLEPSFGFSYVLFVTTNEKLERHTSSIEVKPWNL